MTLVLLISSFLRLTQRSLQFWFPEFDPVPFRIHDPAKLAVIVTFYLGINIDTFAFQLCQDFIQILDLQVDQRLCARREVIGACRKRRPDRVSLRVRIVCFSSFKYRAVILFTFDAKVQAIPIAQLFRIVCLREDSADSSNTFQVLVLFISRGRAASAAALAWAPELDSSTGLDSP